jgi:predicted transposase/invertase (TIGR01784 family)
MKHPYPHWNEGLFENKMAKANQKPTIYHPKRFVSPLTDFAFKKLFGDENNKHILMHFLNSIFTEYHIEDLVLLPTDKIGARQVDRSGYYDLLCTTSTKQTILIEMQNVSHKYFADRLLYYSTWPVQEQGVKGSWDYNIQTVIVLGICFFTLDNNNPNYLTTKLLKDKDTHEIWSHKLQFVLLEIPKFTKSLSQCSNFLDKWTYLLQNQHEMDSIPNEFCEDVFQELLNTCDLDKLSKAEKQKVEHIMLKEEQMYNFTSYAKEQGFEEGEKSGLVKGREEGQRLEKMATVESMLAKQCDWDFISSICGITKQEYREWKKLD